MDYSDYVERVLVSACGKDESYVKALWDEINSLRRECRSLAKKADQVDELREALTKVDQAQFQQEMRAKDFILGALQCKVQKLEQKLAQLKSKRVLKARELKYPFYLARPVEWLIQAQEFDNCSRASQVPQESGVYVFCSLQEERVFYVGQAVNMRRRVCGHDKQRAAGKLTQPNAVTILTKVVSAQHLNHAECFYIGILKPEMNFSVYPDP